MQRFAGTEQSSGRTSLRTAQAPALFGSLAASFRRRLQTWLQRIRQRRALDAIDDWMLRDIGLSRGDAMRERDKRFWQE